MGFEMKAGTGGLVVRIQEAQFEVKWPYNGWKSIIFVGLLLKKKKLSQISISQTLNVWFSVLRNFHERYLTSVYPLFINYGHSYK